MPARIGIIGTGAFADVHAHTVAERADATLVAVASRDTGHAHAFAERFDARPHASVDELIAAADVDALVICVPHDVHEQVTVAALAAGKHVLVEKPLAHSLAAADAIAKAAAGAAGVCMVGHVMRYAPAFQGARRMLDDGTIGEPVYVDSRSLIAWQASRRRRWHRIPPGGGMWLTQGVHAIDRVSWLLGDRASAVYGQAATRFHPPDVQTADDFGHAVLRFAGLDAHITVAGYTRGVSDVSTTVHGTEGQLRVSHRGELAVAAADGEWHRTMRERPESWRGEMMQGEWDAFLHSVGSGVADVDVLYGRYVVAVVDAIRHSQHSGGVELVR